MTARSRARSAKANKPWPFTSLGPLRTLAFDGPEQVGDDVVLGAGGRRRAADEVEDLAVFHAVFGKPLHFSAFVEIDHDHALVGDGGVNEGDRALGPLRDVIERLAADGRHRRRRAENEQDLLLGGAQRDLLERAVGQHVAALERFAEAAARQQRQREEHDKGAYGTRVPNMPAPHPQTHLAPSRHVPYPENAKLAICRSKAAFAIQAIPMILARFRRNSQARTIHALYGAIVAQARSVTFYADFRVPDTVEGRFDLIVLHLVLLLNRLGRRAEVARGFGQKLLGQALLGQELFDAFCRDLDANLREMGVGDLAVPKRMQAFAEAFYGRQAAYLAALDAADERVFEKALARNIFAAGNDAGAAQLARYARAAVTRLDAQDDGALIRGAVVFPSPRG